METETGFPASPPHAQQRFELLQERLVPLWHSIEAMNQDEQTIVVVPSISLDVLEGSDISKYDYSKQSWIPQGDIIELSGKSSNCAWDQAIANCK